MVQTKQPAGVLDPELDGFHEPVLWDVEVWNWGARGSRVRGLQTSRDIPDSLMCQNKRAEGTSQEKGAEADGPSRSDQIQQSKHRFTPTEQSSHHQWS